jgi:hypothetical protein
MIHLYNILEVSIIAAVLCSRPAVDPQDRAPSPVGTFSTSARFSASELALSADSTFQYRFFVDLGGWRKPLEGTWILRQDTIYLSSYAYPRLLGVVESISECDSLVISVLDRTGNTITSPIPFTVRANDWLPENNPWFHFLIPTNSSSPDSMVFGPWVAQKNPANSPTASLYFTIGGVTLTHRVLDPRCNVFTVQFDLSGSDFFREVFFQREPILFRGDRVIRQVNGAWINEYPMLRSESQE